MRLKEIKDSFCLFMRNYDRSDFSILMEFLRYLVDEFDDDPNRIYEYLKRKSRNDVFPVTTRPIEAKAAPKVRISETKQTSNETNESQIEVKEEPVSQEDQIMDDNDSETYSEIDARVQNKKSKLDVSSKCQICEWARTNNQVNGANVCINCRSFFLRNYTFRNMLKCDSNEGCKDFSKRTSCKKCRFRKCLMVGLKLGSKAHRRRKASNLNIEGAKCTCCKTSDHTVRTHYGSLMCSRCFQWYANYKHNTKRIPKLKCFSIDTEFENRCVELPDFDIIK
ncbi:unnamed protein product, partial [Brachionus calyciflorus]